MAVFRWRSAESRQCVDLGGRRSLHAFACEEWCDPRYLAAGDLRGLSEVYLAPGQAYAMPCPAGHTLMVISLDGSIACAGGETDSPLTLGEGETLRLTAAHGASVTGSNPTSRIVRFVALRFAENEGDAVRGRELIRCAEADRLDRWSCFDDFVIVSGEPGVEAGRAQRLSCGVSVFRAELSPEMSLRHALQPCSRYYLQLLRGELLANRQPMAGGDGVYLHGQSSLLVRNLSWLYTADLLLVEMAMPDEGAWR